MRGAYTATGQTVSLTNSARTLFWFTPPSNRVIELVGIYITNTSNGTNFQAECTLVKGTAPATTQYTQMTAAPQETGDQAAAMTAIWMSQGATAGADLSSTTLLRGEGYASLNGWFYEPPPEARFRFNPSVSVGCKLTTATYAATVFDITFVFTEIG